MIITPVILFHTAPIEQAKVENEESTKFVLTKEENVISVVRSRSVFVLGDSQFDRTARLAAERAVLERERGSSYSGNGTAKKLYQDRTNNCVKWFKAQTGRGESLGYAGRIRARGLEPRVGAGALEWNHISLVVAVKSNSVIVHESNYIKGWITEREIPLSKLRGFYY